MADAHAAPDFASFASALLALGLGQSATYAGPRFAQQKVGVNSAVNPDATGTPPGAPTRRLVIGQEVVHNEDIKTDAEGQTQILFLDESAMTVGPNADVTIDNFVYDPTTGTGKMTAMSASAGAMRFVGGKLSKQDNAVTLRTPAPRRSACAAAIFVADVQPGGGRRDRDHFCLRPGAP